MKRSACCSLALAATLLTGCLTHRYGDARLRENSDALTVTQDRFYLKPVPLDRVATHTLQVRGIPFAIYPTHLLVPLTPTEAELKSGFPWEEVRLRITFQTVDGQQFFSKEVSLAEAERGRSPGTYHQLDVQFRPPERHSWRPPENMPHYTDYDIVVAVLQPSRSKNSATLYAETYVK
jgi:hypothetical protein